MNAWQQEKYELFGLNVAYYRRLRKLTQEQLSEMVGLERVTIGKIETAASGASLDTVFEIADALEVEPLKLFDFRK